MTTKNTPILIAVVAAVVLAAVGIRPLIPSREVGVLERYSGTLNGLGYAGGRPDAGGDGRVLFKYFNGGAQSIELRPRAILRQPKEGTEWVHEASRESNVFRVPARHLLTFEVPCPAGADPWVVTFEKSTLPNPVQRFADMFKQLLGKPTSFPPFEGVISTPLMQGLQPKVTPGSSSNAGPATSSTNSSVGGPGRHP